MNLKEFNQEQILKAFYISGSIIFLMVGVANSFTNFHNWEYFILSAKVSSVASNLFNYFLAVFFYFLLKKMPKAPDPIKEEDLDQIIKEATKSQKK